MTDEPKIRLHEITLEERAVEMRLPFQFGNTEVRRTAEIYCRVVAEIGGKTCHGVSAQLMVPRWFDKRAGLSNEETVDELRASSSAAVLAGKGLSGTVAQISDQIREAAPGLMPADTPMLAAGFGPALVEMALIDAACSHAEMAFWEAARSDLFGLGARLPPDISRAQFAADCARIAAPERIALRHTIGFDAPIDARPADAPDDNLPVTLQEVIAATGISAWKIKLKGDPQADASRLLALQTALAGKMAGGVTLDANEQYRPDAFRDLLERLRAPDFADIAARVRFFEQPFPRDVALDMRNDFGAKLVIDESDDHRDAFATALANGWSGTSIKSCKGVLRALLNMVRARATGAILSGEDLTCQPGLCWTQDTAMASACGVVDLERNGHHFAGGMQGASNDERAAMRDRHPDIFRLSGGATDLRIEDGHVRIGTLASAGFGASGAMFRLSD